MAVPWPGRGSKGKGSSRKEPKHQSSVTGTLRDEAGIFHRNLEGDNYSLEHQHYLKTGSNKLSLLKSANPFEMPTDISYREHGRFGRKHGDTTVERTPKEFTPKFTTPVKQYTPDELKSAAPTINGSLKMVNAITYLWNQYQKGKLPLEDYSTTIRFIKEFQG